MSTTRRKKQLVVDTLVNWNLKAKQVHSASFLNLLSGSAKIDVRAKEIKELLMIKNQQMNMNHESKDEMEDYQTEEIFHNADILSELIFAEKAIDKVNGFNSHNTNNN